MIADALDYNPETGDLIWNQKMGTRVKPGDVAGSVDGYGYKIIGFKGERYKAHRVAWKLHYGEWPSGHIDHIDQDRLNNKIDNLRVATRSENMRNQRVPDNNTSGVIGVSWGRVPQRWQAKIDANGKKRYLGSFNIKEDAIEARKQAEKELGYHPNHGQPRIAGSIV